MKCKIKTCLNPQMPDGFCDEHQGMRAFFSYCVDSLPVFIGNRAQTNGWESEDLVILFDALERVSRHYSYIPDANQKEIIETQMIKDLEYQNLNARIVAKWLEQNGKKFFKEIAHEPIEEYEPATDEQKDFWINEWKKELAKVVDNFTVPIKGNGQRMKEQLDNAGINYEKAPKTEEENVNDLQEMLDEAKETKENTIELCKVCNVNPCKCI